MFLQDKEFRIRFLWNFSKVIYYTSDSIENIYI